MRMSEVRMRSASGFSLVELMIVIVIVAVLMGVALPAYRVQVIRGHRAAAKAEILEIAVRQEQYLLANRSYTDDESKISYSLPPEVLSRYSFDISTTSSSAVPKFTITFTPRPGGGQDDDYTLVLTSAGEKTPGEAWLR